MCLHRIELPSLSSAFMSHAFPIHATSSGGSFSAGKLPISKSGNNRHKVWWHNFELISLTIQMMPYFKSLSRLFNRAAHCFVSGRISKISTLYPMGCVASNTRRLACWSSITSLSNPCFPVLASRSIQQHPQQLPDLHKPSLPFPTKIGRSASVLISFWQQKEKGARLPHFTYPQNRGKIDA